MPPASPNQYGQGPFGNTGYGPVNYQNRAPDPFSQMEDYINYQNMVREQQVQQYQQQMIVPPDMSQRQLYRTLMMRGRYGQGVDAEARETMFRTFQRRNDLQREEYASRLSMEAINFGAWTAIGAGTAGAFGGGLAGLAVGGFLAPTLLAAPIGWGMQQTMGKELARRAYGANVAMDIDLYRNRIGGNFSYQQATYLGRMFQQQAFAGEFRRTGEQAEFFNPAQQMQIFKTGLATGMLDSRNLDVGTMMTRGGGTVTPEVAGAIKQGGTPQQFMKNVQNMLQTTKDVVRLLSTTTEGAMSVMNELNRTGFRSFTDIRNQVVQAKAYGMITGVGAQNMMSIGQAGAQAVQGTPWSAAAGATMYQQAATTAALQAQVSPMMARAVTRAGGIGQAGAAIATAQMNMLQSGMGTRVVAAMLNPNGTANAAMVDRMMRGGMSAYDITSRAGAVGYAMGAGGRAAFDLTRQRFLEAAGPEVMDMMMQKTFDAWRANKQGNVEQQAWVYAGMFTNDPAQRELIMQNLTTPKFYEKQWAAKEAVRAGIETPIRPMYRNPLARSFINTMAGIGEFGQQVGQLGIETANATVGAGVNYLAGLGKRRWYGVLEGMEGAWGTNQNPYGYVSRMPTVSAADVANQYYGVNREFTQGQFAALKGATVERIAEVRKRYGIGQTSAAAINAYANKGLMKNINQIYNALSPEQYAYLTTELAAVAGGTVQPAALAEAYGDTGVLKMLGITKDSSLRTTLYNSQRARGFATSVLEQLGAFAKNQQAYVSDFTKLPLSTAETQQANILTKKYIGANNLVGGELLSFISGQERGISANVLKNVTGQLTNYNISQKKGLITNYQGLDIDENAAKQANDVAVKAMKKYVDATTNRVNKSQGSYQRLEKVFGGDVSMTARFIADWSEGTSFDDIQKRYGDTLKKSMFMKGGVVNWEEVRSVTKDAWISGQSAAEGNLIQKVARTAEDVELTQGLTTAALKARSFEQWREARFAGKNLSQSQKALLQQLYTGVMTTGDKIDSKDLQELGKVITDSKNFSLDKGGSLTDTFNKLHAKITGDVENTFNKSQDTKATSEAAALSKSIRDYIKPTEKGAKWTDKDGNIYTSPKDAEERHQFEVKRLQELQMVLPKTGDDATASNTGQMNASVSPSVLNYWNNRWTYN